MTQNRRRKQAIREAMEAHGVPYSVAARIVDRDKDAKRVEVIQLPEEDEK